ncbi:MAG: kojibiose phosphorylase [Bellilinea sp.]|nr:MAG: kojibiose phosphorylase [Bellilinea sp.]
MLNERNWIVTETCFDPKSQNHAETIFTIGNGYLGTRGAHEERYPGEERTTFIHGVFDDVPIVFTELVNAPDWLDLTLNLGGEWFSLSEGEILAYQRQLDLRNGLLSRRVEWRSPRGACWHILFERFASLTNPHLLCQRVTIKAFEDTTLEVRTTLSGDTDNLNYKHWEWIGQGFGQNSAWLHLRTRSTGIELGAATRLSILGGQKLRQTAWDTRNAPTLVAATQLKSGDVVEIEKITAFYTSRETTDPQSAARRALESLPVSAWKGLWESHARAWQREWEACDVVIEGDDRAHLAVRFSLFQLLAAAPRQDERVSIGAKALSGYGYRGHVFWDTEIFMLPFFTYTRPEIARNLLSYRFHTLEGARKKARENGFKGAQFAWESAATGEEVTPTWVPHPTDRTRLIRIWTGDIQIHISADVCYAIWQYWQATGDDDFMIHRGAEIFLDVARFWASRAEWNAETGCYEFTDVIGPDEYHDHVDNNAYTNALARWQLLTALKVMNWLQERKPDKAAALRRLLELDENELARWREVAEKIYWKQDAASGLIEQFEGYFQRRQIDLQALEPRTQSIQSLLGIEGASEANILKQPDVVMLAYLLPELFDEKTLRANYEYYNARTDHTFGSSLGPAIHAIIACRVGKPDEAYQHFLRAALADLEDVRGNAHDGIHAASAGGIWQAIVFGFGGLKFEPEGPKVNPCLPRHWRRLKFRISYRGQPYEFDLLNSPAGGKGG